MFRLGLNPYGLTYTLGLQGLGTDRVNPRGSGLDGFLACARAIDARCVELDWRWLLRLDDATLRDLGRQCREEGRDVLVSAWLTHDAGETLADPIRMAAGLGAVLLRLHLTPVLEGARARAGAAWPAYLAHARDVLLADAPRAADAGVDIGLENHQDLCSEELLDLADAAGPHVGTVLDTGNAFAVGEDPVACATRVAPRVRHLHLKDYRAQFTDEGVRLVRCALGDGCVPFDAIVAALGVDRRPLTASIEPGALDARHVRFFTRDWWRGYPPRRADEFACAVGRLGQRAFGPIDDARTPWEARAAGPAIAAYEQAQIARSAAYLRAAGWMETPR